MKNKTYKRALVSLLSKGVVAILGGAALVSCGAQLGYTETDGIYYDPSKDKIEQRVAWQGNGDYNHEESIIGQSQKVQKQQDSRYSNKNWGENQKISTSDWGTYAGTQNNYYYNGYSVWNSPYYHNFYSPYYFGNYNSYFGDFYSWHTGFYGTPWGYGYYRPYRLGYYNYWGNRYYGYNNWYYDPFFSPYYRGYSPYYGGYYQMPVRNYKRSNPDEIYRGNSQYRSYNDAWGTSRQNQYPNSRQSHYPSSNDGFQRTSNWGNPNNTNMNRGGNYNNSSSNWGGRTNNSGSFHDR